MERFVKTTDHDLWFEEIFSPDEFVSPFGDDDYVLLLVNDRTDVPDPEQKNLSERLIATGCRYACSFGFECSSWDDPIDYAYIFSDRNLDPPNDRFVMTTGHEGETIEEVVHYLRWNTIFDDFIPTRFPVLFLGKDDALKVRTLAALTRVFPWDAAA